MKGSRNALVSSLKARDLLKLKPIGCAQSCVDLSVLDQYIAPSYRMERCVDVEHRGLVYVVGCWAGWEGAFWVVECRTGIIFRGTLEYIKDMIVLCSGAYHEPHATKYQR